MRGALSNHKLGRQEAQLHTTKKLMLTMLGLVWLIGKGAEPGSNEIERKLEQLERRQYAEMARSGDTEARERGYLYSVLLLRVGDSSVQVTEKLCPPWSPRATNYFVAKYPFSEWVPWTNRSLILEWQSEDKLQIGWPRIVFGLFSDAEKTNLVDALLYDGDEGVQPLVDGPYSRQVLAVKAGDNMEAVFKRLRQRRCEYRRGKDGTWLVRTLYYTWDGRFIHYEADAGTGVILRVWEGTL